MHRLTEATITLAFAGLTTVGLGAMPASASDTAATAGGTPQPAYDPCPAGYWGMIVGYDDSNSTGRRVYACVKL